MGIYRFTINVMSQNTDWAGTRGEKWRKHLAGMEATLAAVDEPLIGALRLDAPYRIADIACGGGGTTLEIRRRAPAGSIVHGFDVSPPLIEVARGRRQSDDAGIDFNIADVGSVVPAAPYDRLVSRFGIMFFDDPTAAFANLARWLKAGGRFAFAVWGPAAENPWLASVRQVVGEIVELSPVDPEAPGQFRYAIAGKLTHLLEAAGFGNIEVHHWRGLLPIGGGLPAADAAKFALASFASFGELLAEAGDEALEKAQQALAAGLSRHEMNGAVSIEAAVHIVSGSGLGG
jgi:SAM-dependent methyltransferase